MNEEGSSFKFLSSVVPFTELTRAELVALARNTTEKRFSKGETIFHEGDSADSVWLLHKGRVQIIKYASNGQPLTIESLGPGEIFGTLCRLNDESPTYPCTAVPSEEVVALKIPDARFMGWFKGNSCFTQSVCSLCVKRLKEFQSLRCFAQEPAPVKVADMLLRLHQTHGDLIPFTKREVAELCGITTETAFRILASFERKRWVTNRYKAVHIKNADALSYLTGRKK